MRPHVLIAAAIAAVAAVAPLAGQTRNAVPRLADGHPDLQGTYDLATLTPVARRTASKPRLSASERISCRTRPKTTSRTSHSQAMSRAGCW